MGKADDKKLTIFLSIKDIELQHRLLRQQIYKLSVPYLIYGEQVCGTRMLDENLDYNLVLGSKEAHDAMVDSVLKINKLYDIRPKLQELIDTKRQMEKKYPHLAQLEKSDLEDAMREETQK